jgi:hypothetical protein
VLASRVHGYRRSTVGVLLPELGVVSYVGSTMHAGLRPPPGKHGSVMQLVGRARSGKSAAFDRSSPASQSPSGSSSATPAMHASQSTEDPTNPADQSTMRNVANASPWHFSSSGPSSPQQYASVARSASANTLGGAESGPGPAGSEPMHAAIRTVNATRMTPIMVAAIAVVNVLLAGCWPYRSEPEPTIPIVKRRQSPPPCEQIETYVGRVPDRPDLTQCERAEDYAAMWYCEKVLLDDWAEDLERRLRRALAWCAPW